ncbi:MAG: cytochrome c [candidate division NC10 bacterium]|nr:cytochrome c [candidate division NC10 bacterium]
MAVSFGLVVALWWVPSASSMPWSQDMVRQPSVRPQQEPRPAAPGALPTTAPRRTGSRGEAREILRNPVEASPASVERGLKLYRIHCAACHGPGGQGDGPVVARFLKPPSLTSERAKKYPDGFLYGTIRHGGPKMPSYREGLSDRERWDVVNYLRSLQGR